MYDYLLGGTDNFESDRAACRQLLQLAPDARQLATINRLFLKRAVHFLAKSGIRQFLDHGSGLPTQENVHQVAQAVEPAARVVYIDHDPLVFAQGRMLLETTDSTAVVKADVRDTQAVMQNPRVQALFDLSRPVGALLVSVLHCIPDEDDPWALVRGLVSRLPSGSYLVVCQWASDDPEVRESLTDLMLHLTRDTWGRVRSTEEVRRFFDGLDVVDDLCEVSTWRPDSRVGPRMRSREVIGFGGVARIP